MWGGYGLVGVAHNMATQVGRAITHYALGDPINYDPAKSAMKAMASFEKMVNFVGGSGSFLQFIAPTQADLAIQVGTNTSWNGASIHPEAMEVNPAPPPAAQMYYPDASEQSQDIAQFINQLSGGNPYDSGMLDIYPNDIDYVVNSMFGAVSRIYRDSYDFAVDAFTGEFSGSKLPIVGSMWNGQDHIGTNIEYYQLRRRIIEAKTKLDRAKKRGDDERVADIHRRFGTMLAGWPRLNKTDNRIKELREDINQVESSSVLEAEEKRKRVDKLKKQIRSTQKQLIDVIVKARSED